MTSKRLYYQDAYKTRFKANIVERVHDDVQTAVILDQTYFYPASGGQPHDLGAINNIPVLDVTIRESDNAVLHWIGEGDIWSDDITAEIDWTRRFDHMQQHTGQHLLSQAFIQVAEAETVSFHLSDKSVTIDLQANTLQPSHIESAEDMANRAIWQNRQVRIQAVTLEEAKALPLRKIPPTREGKLRLVEIEDFDLSACGGTHVAATGEIGQIKIVKLERNGDNLRVEFRCGQRALQDYRLKNSAVNQLTAVLTTGTPDIVNAVTKLQSEVKKSRRTLKQQRNAIIRLDAENLLAQAKAKKKKKNIPIIITRVYPDSESDPGQLRALANQIIKEDGVIVLLGLAGEKSRLIFGRSATAPGQMNQLLKPALQLLGSASGGGTETMAQGGGPKADVARVEQAVARAEKLLIGQL